MLGLGSSPAPTPSPCSAEADKQGFVISCPPAQRQSFSVGFVTAMIQTRPLLSSQNFFQHVLHAALEMDTLSSPMRDRDVQPSPLPLMALYSNPNSEM